MGFCQTNTLVKTTPQYKKLYCLKCRSWGCPDCAPERAKDVRGLARRGQPTTFLTLTIRSNADSHPDELARELARAWRLLRKRLEKRYKIKHLPYLAVFEKTKRGMPHLHIMLRMRYIPQKWISEQMQELIGSPIVGIEKIRDQNKMANYVTKYITKDLAQFKGCKRYFRSQNYELQKRKYEKVPLGPGEYWSQTGFDLWRTIDMYMSKGWQVWGCKKGWFATPPTSSWRPSTGLGP